MTLGGQRAVVEKYNKPKLVDLYMAALDRIDELTNRASGMTDRLSASWQKVTDLEEELLSTQQIVKNLEHDLENARFVSTQKEHKLSDTDRLRMQISYDFWGMWQVLLANGIQYKTLTDPTEIMPAVLYERSEPE